MNIKEYTPLAARTCKELPLEEHIHHMVLGIVGEAGELIDAYKKHLIYGKELDIVNIKEEIGDIFWYVVNLGLSLGFTPETLEELCQEHLGWTYLKETSRSPTVAVFSLAENAEDILLITDLGERQESFPYLLRGLDRLLQFFKLTGGEVLTTNINKLAARYGDTYSDYNAINRDLNAERKVLEK